MTERAYGSPVVIELGFKKVAIRSGSELCVHATANLEIQFDRQAGYQPAITYWTLSCA
jgi:hypothetical protein